MSKYCPWIKYQFRYTSDFKIHWNLSLCTFWFISIDFFDYKKLGFRRCNETFAKEQPIGFNLEQVRKNCDDIEWCTMIYQPLCTDTTDAPQEMLMCSSEVPPLDEDNRESCLWVKSKFKILIFELINNWTILKALKLIHLDSYIKISF